MENAIILHGKPRKERYLDPAQPKPHQANWLPWLKDNLEREGIPAEIPAMPEPYAPVYEAWRKMFEACTEVNKGTALIGHSAGADFAVHWLSENPDVSIAYLGLVAPWHDLSHEYGREFSDYTIDPGLASRVGRITIFNSLEDSPAIQQSVDLLATTLPLAQRHDYIGYGHFMLGNSMKTAAFPDLLRDVLRAAHDR